MTQVKKNEKIKEILGESPVVFDCKQSSMGNKFLHEFSLKGKDGVVGKVILSGESNDATTINFLLFICENHPPIQLVGKKELTTPWIDKKTETKT